MERATERIKYLPIIAFGLYTLVTVGFFGVTWLENVYLTTWTGSKQIESFPDLVEKGLLINSIIFVLIMPLVELAGVVLGLVAVAIQLFKKSRGLTLMKVAFGLLAVVWMDGLMTWLLLCAGKALSP